MPAACASCLDKFDAMQMCFASGSAENKPLSRIRSKSRRVALRMPKAHNQGASNGNALCQATSLRFLPSWIKDAASDVGDLSEKQIIEFVRSYRSASRLHPEVEVVS